MFSWLRKPLTVTKLDPVDENEAIVTLSDGTAVRVRKSAIDGRADYWKLFREDDGTDFDGGQQPRAVIVGAIRKWQWGIEAERRAKGEGS